MLSSFTNGSSQDSANSEWDFGDSQLYPPLIQYSTQEQQVEPLKTSENSQLIHTQDQTTNSLDERDEAGERNSAPG